MVNFGLKTEYSIKPKLLKKRKETSAKMMILDFII